MSMQLPSSSSSSSSDGFKFDVFISFRGPDTRYGFTGNLYKALCNKGIYTFIDDEELQRGDEITPSLLKSIEDSRIAVIVFSKSYASSSFCLDELAHIIHYFKAKGRVVLPVFYDVDPSQVRHQNDGYGEALAKHEDRFQNNKKKMKRLLKWRKALKQAADLSGYHFNLGKEYEHNFIEKIVKDVSNKINHIPLHVADYPVGLESRMLEVSLLLDLGSSDEVCIIGIHGAGGMGKTTLSRAVYNSIVEQFEGSCFLHDVRENSVKHGLEYLQEQLLSKTINLNFKIHNVSEGIPLIKQRLSQKKILLILDDVDKLEQLRYLVGEPTWLGPGSKVLITTRDRHLLESRGIKRTYEVCGLNKEEALELFRQKVAKNKTIDSNYEYILNRAVTYASGLPLAIEVVGSNFSGMHMSKWNSTLDKYKRVPDKDIQEILKVSFDALHEEEKRVFLDISCCLKGYKLVEIEDILHSHYDYCIKDHVEALVDKSLIKIDFGVVTLHDLLEDMGKDIVRQESPNNPGERSRLWFHEDIIKVLKEYMGTANIEMIYLNCPSMDNVIEWNGKAFKKMTNLKTLIIKNGHFSKDPEYLPSGLRVLTWEGYPLISPSSLIWNKKFNYMKDLKLISCKYLTHIPDVSGLPNLKKFSLKLCKNLVTIHNSIGNLTKLEILVLYACAKLESIPPLQLPFLKELSLFLCKSLKSFPELLCKMTNIKEIALYGTTIGELPFSFQYLSELRCLYIYESGMFRFPKHKDKMYSKVFTNLESLALGNCNLSDECLPILLKWCVSVKDLDLSHNNFKILPECLSECHLLSNLNLQYCGSLEEIRGFPPNLKKLYANGCKLSYSSKIMLLSKKLHEAGGTEFFFSNETEPIGIPDWFDHQIRGHTLSFWFRKKIPSITSLLLFPGFKKILRINLFVFGDYLSNYSSVNSYIDQDTENAYLFDLKLEEQIKKNQGDLVPKMNKALLENEWIHVELSLVKNYWNSVDLDFSAEMGIHVLKDKSNTKEEDVLFTNPYNDTEDEDDSSDDESKSLEVSETEFVQRQSLEISDIETVDFARMGIHEEGNREEDVIFTNPYNDIEDADDSSDDESNAEEDDDCSDDESKSLEVSETEFAQRQSLEVSDIETVDFAQMGIHEDGNTEEDVIFTNPYNDIEDADDSSDDESNAEEDDNCSDDESKSLEVSETEFVQRQSLEVSMTETVDFVQIGIHEENNMEEDVISTNPYTDTKSDEDKNLEVSETKTVERQNLEETISETETVQRQSLEETVSEEELGRCNIHCMTLLFERIVSFFARRETTEKCARRKGKEKKMEHQPRLDFLN